MWPKCHSADRCLLKYCYDASWGTKHRLLSGAINWLPNGGHDLPVIIGLSHRKKVFLVQKTIVCVGTCALLPFLDCQRKIIISRRERESARRTSYFLTFSKSLEAKARHREMRSVIFLYHVIPFLLLLDL